MCKRYRWRMSGVISDNKFKVIPRTGGQSCRAWTNQCKSPFAASISYEEKECLVVNLMCFKAIAIGFTATMPISRQLHCYISSS